MINKFVKFYKVEIKGINLDTHTVDAVVSTKKQDRMGDVVVPDAFSKNLKNYKTHPVLLSSHNYRELMSQIGKALSIKVTDDGLEAKFEYFVGKGNPEADWAWVLAQKNMAAFSIGFQGNKFEYIKEKDENGNEMITGRKFTEVELLEVSQVLVPANKDALQMSMAESEEKMALCELITKNFKEEEFQKAEEERDPHYTDGLFGKGGKKIVPTPIPEKTKKVVDVAGLITETVTQIREKA